MRTIRETTSRITCVACQRNAESHSDKLCQECAGDPEAMRLHCTEIVAAHRAELDRQWEILKGAIYSSDDRLYDRWANFHIAIGKNQPSAQEAMGKTKAGTLQGPLADLIRLWLAYTDAKAVYEERQAWAERVYQAIGELDHQQQPRPHEYFVTLGESRRAGKCRSCGAPICWKTTISGAQVPLSLATLIDRDGELFAMSHFTDCPQATAWSKA